MIMNKLKKDTCGIATLVIAIVVILVIAGAGVVAYVALSNSDDPGNDDPGSIPALGGPGLKAGERLTYTLSGDIAVKSTGPTVTIDDAVTGTFVIGYTQESTGGLTMSVTMNVAYDIMGETDSINETFSTTISSLDMTEFGTGTVDASSLKELGYTDADIRAIQALIDKYQTKMEKLSTFDGNIDVEKRTYSYDWNDFKSLIPDTEYNLDSIPISKFDTTLTLWFGKDILYKVLFEIDMKGNFSNSPAEDSIKISGTLELTGHSGL
ncbi:MAG: hypothetical protein FWG41_04025 [Methanomassiliicoccaceae archaeon]|nr:hypothetical protein [Methanomassiliicoccaceae archaeon]